MLSYDHQHNEKGNSGVACTGKRSTMASMAEITTTTNTTTNTFPGVAGRCTIVRVPSPLPASGIAIGVLASSIRLAEMQLSPRSARLDASGFRGTK